MPLKTFDLAMIFMSTKLMDVLKEFQSIIVTNKQIITYMEHGKIIIKRTPGQFERVSRNCSCAGVFKSLNPIFAGRKKVVLVCGILDLAGAK